MKRPNRFWLMSVCALACLLGAARWFHAPHVFAQQDTQVYDDSLFYISAYVDVDSSYNLYLDSYMVDEVPDYYEDVDGIKVVAYADEDSQPYYAAYNEGDNVTPAEVPLQSNAPVSPGHEYGLESDGWACYDTGEGNCGPWEYVGSAYAHVNVASPAPQISSLSTYSVNQGDQGTLTVTGSNFIETSGDQLTLNFSGGSNPFTLTSAPPTCTSSCMATFSYDFSGYPAGSYTLSVTNNEGTSNSETFTVIYTAPPSPPSSSPPVDPCAVTSSPQVGFTSIVPTGTVGGSGSMAVSFSGTAFAAISPTVTYGPYSTPSSIAANIAALITKNYYRYGLGARAFGPIIVYSGNATLGTVSNVVTGPSFTTDGSPTAGTEAQNVCENAPPPPQSMYAVAYSAYIPVDHVTGPDQCTYLPPPLYTPQITAQLLYRGDAFHNTYRVTQAVSLNFAVSQASGNFNDTGTTENYGFGSPYNGPNLSSQDDDAVYADYRTSPPTGMADCYLRNAIGKAPTTGWQISSTVNPSAASVTMTGSGQNPLSFPIGSIYWNMTTQINVGSNTGFVYYDHTCYPAHQVKVANTTLYSYPSSTNTTFSNSPIYIVNCLTGINSHVTGTSPTMTVH